MPNRLSILAALALLAPAALLAACGSNGGGDPEKPTVTATTGILADIAEQVAGDDATVIQVIPDGSDPHDFQLSAKDRAEIEDSSLLVSNGAGLEQGIPVDEIDVGTFVLSDHVGELRPFEQEGTHEEEHAEEEDHHGEDEHGGGDPHVWMDPTRVARAVPELADALAEADPDHAAAYRERAGEYESELEALDSEIAEVIDAVPEPDRELVTSHDAVGYFAARYGLEVLATPFPASGAEAEPSAAVIQEVEDAIAEADVPTVFAQETDDPEVLEQIADRAGVAIVTELLVEAPGDAGSYLEMLRRDAELISEGLAPTSGR